jgi:hypothetical protein
VEPGVGIQWGFGQANSWPESTASAAKYLNRATVLGDLLLTNSERPSNPAHDAIPVNTAVELFAAAYREPGPGGAPVKWANSVASTADSLPMAHLANPALPPIDAVIGMPVNEVMEPQ